MSTGTSTFVIRWINFLTMILAIAVICFGIWMSTHHDECRKSLTLPIMGLGALILIMFIVTNTGSGHSVPGLGYKEYHLQDYSVLFSKELNNTKSWRRLKSCLVKSKYCNDLPKKYKTLKEYKTAELTPIQAGCCRPPSEICSWTESRRNAYTPYLTSYFRYPGYWR